MDTIVTEKRCSKCKTVKPLSCYWVDRKRKDGLTPQCKDCHKIYTDKTKEQRNLKNKERYYKDIEKSRESSRKHAKKSREKNSIAIYIRQKIWRKENSEKYKQYYKNFYEKNIDKVRATHKEWLANNKDKNREYKANRRARKLGAGGTYTANQFKDLCEKYHNVCLCCGSSGKLVADHVVPLSEGGNNSIENIQPLCFSCNARKYTKTIDYRY